MDYGGRGIRVDDDVKRKSIGRLGRRVEWGSKVGRRNRLSRSVEDLKKKEKNNCWALVEQSAKNCMYLAHDGSR